MENIISIKNLKKYFGDVKAVDNISFNVKKGSLFAFLGLNGAGKSTTINIICTLLNKDDGDVIVSGLNLDESAEKIREVIGVVFQGSILDKSLTVLDNLTIRASFYNITGQAWKSRIAELTDLLDLSDLLKRQYGKLSGGQKRRVDIARALINAPEILVLDEPTTGLDPQTRKTVWEVIEKLRKEKNMTVFLTTHYMEESNVADNVVILDSGKIVAEGSPIELKNKYSRDKLFVYEKRNKLLDEAFANNKFVYKDNCYQVNVDSAKQAKQLLKKHDLLITDFELIKGDMDDVFLNVTGKTLSGGQNA